MKRGLITGAAIVVAAIAATPATATTMNVNTIEDGFDADGKCSIREAVEASRLNKKEDGCAKGETSRDVIRLKAANYQLSFVSTNENANSNGDFDFTGGGPVTVVGEGKGKTEIHQNADDRIIDVRENGNVTLSKLRLVAGDVTSLGSAQGRGGAARVEGGKLVVGRAEVASTDAFYGGGLYATLDGNLKVANSVMSATDALIAGGAIATAQEATGSVRRTTISNADANSASFAARGAIISAEGGLFKVVDSTLQGSTATSEAANLSAAGGAIYSTGDLLVTRSLIQGNGTTALDDNTAEHGGALYLGGGNVRIVNSTVYNNRAGFPGDNDGIGGGIYVAGANVSLQHSTFDSNVATSVGDAVARTAGSAELLGSLLDDEEDPCEGAVTSAGFNVSEDADPENECGFGDSDVENVSTGTLSSAPVDNGGPTLTIAIGGQSPARNLVPTNLCKPATGKVDQRGFERPRGALCEAGAFEFKAVP